jgi:alkylhydroperoxidase family enzyme
VSDAPDQEPAGAPPTPRIPPAGRDELGLVNALIARVSARFAGTTRPLNLFTTVGRNRGLFRRWLLFAGALMPRGGLPRRDTELVILWVYHRRMGLAAGLTAEQVEAAAGGGPGPFSPRQELLLCAVGELHRDDAISAETFAGLRSELSDRDFVELCMLAGHYRMLAGLINSLAIEPDVHR